MDWFLYDRDPRHEKVKTAGRLFHILHITDPKYLIEFAL